MLADDPIAKHKRVEEDKVQGKGKAKVFMLERKDPWLDRYALNRPRRMPQWLAQSSRSPYIGSLKR